MHIPQLYKPSARWSTCVIQAEQRRNHGIPYVPAVLWLKKIMLTLPTVTTLLSGIFSSACSGVNPSYFDRSSNACRLSSSVSSKQVLMQLSNFLQRDPKEAAIVFISTEEMIRLYHYSIVSIANLTVGYKPECCFRDSSNE